MLENRYIKLSLYIFLAFYFSLFFSRKINLTTADLGRHITNGRVLFETGKIVSTNYYSYTEPDFPVVNHHWLSGPIFYLLDQNFGFKGISIFYLILSGLTVLFFIKAGEEKANILIAVTAALLLIPLISSRKEVRPEGISYLFISIYYFLMLKFSKGAIDIKRLLVYILPLQLIWVNSHIFFIMGIGILGAFSVIPAYEFATKKKDFSYLRPYLTLVLAAIAVSLINPYFVKGLLEPLGILREYGYRIIENQTVFFMQKRSPSFNYFYFELLALIFVVSFVHIIISKKLSEFLPHILITIFFLILGFRAIRGIPIFAMVLVPYLSIYVNSFYSVKLKPLLITIGILFIFSLIPGTFYSMYDQASGLGAYAGVEDSAEFFIRNKINGPVFNNYDIGGYLIYYLYGNERVFVDNRPEAYSVDFFQEIYEPMQADEVVWKLQDSMHDFNAIYFYRHDATQFAQPFLIKRIQDSEWVPVFVDDFVLLLLRNNDQNKRIIEKYALPEGYFAFTRT